MTKEMNHEALNANLRMINKQGERTLEALRVQDAAAAEKLEKIGKLLSDESFAKAFAATHSAEEAVELFAQNGLKLTSDEVTVLAKQIVEIVKKLVENGGELSEEDLEQIAGGSLWDSIWKGVVAGLVGGASAGAITGTCIFPGVGTAAGAVYGAGGGAFLGLIGAIADWLC